MSSFPRRAPVACPFLVASLLLFAACATGLSDQDLLGAWGGDHMGFTLGRDGGTVEYDCASGTVAADWGVTSDGRFSATGSYLPGHGGPIGEHEDTTSRPARYQGSIHGSVMSLTVTLTDSAQTLGVFLLTKGGNPAVFKCL